MKRFFFYLLLSAFAVLLHSGQVFAAYENTYQNTNNPAKDIIGVAQTQVGYMEGSLEGNVQKDDNYTKYGLWYPYQNGYGEWCAMFMSWCANQAGIPNTVVPKHCSCTVGIQWFQNQGQWQASGTYLPKPGDIIYFGTMGKPAHVGIVESQTGASVQTIEGNSSNKCQRKTYFLNDPWIMGYGVPVYNGKVTEENQDLSYPVPIKTYMPFEGRLTTYFSKNGEEYGYIDGSTDECRIMTVYNDGWSKVEYPVPNGKKTGYCRTEDLFPNSVPRYEAGVSENRDVFRKPDLRDKFGTVYSWDEITVMGKRDDKVQILYPLDSGGYKMGWIRESDLENETPPDEKEDALLALNTVSIRPGQEATLALQIKNNPGVMGFGLLVGFDSQVMELTSVERGSLLQAGILDYADRQQEDGSFKILWSDTGNLQEDGELLTLHFQLKDQALEGTYPVSLSIIPEDTFNEVWEEIPFACTAGDIKVSEFLSGDVNGDGLVNNKDAAMISRYLVRKEELNERQIAAADFNGDGTVNNKDAASLSRHLVGKE